VRNSLFDHATAEIDINLAFLRPKRLNTLSQFPGLAAWHKKSHSMEIKIPDFWRRQRNQRRLTLENQSAKLGRRLGSNHRS
jgi:hypothetical protein